MEFQVNYDGKTVDLFDDDARKKFLDGYVDASLENKLDLEKFLMTEIDDRQRRRGLHCGAPVVGEGDTFAGYRIGAASLEALSSEPREEPPTVINRWYLRNKEGERAEVVIYEKDGKRWHKKQLLNPEPAARFSLLTRSMAQRMRSNPLSAELEARKKLKSLISHVQWYSYELSGVFIEEGRSGVHYFLRKGLPTLALPFANVS